MHLGGLSRPHPAPPQTRATPLLLVSCPTPPLLDNHGGRARHPRVLWRPGRKGEPAGAGGGGDHARRASLADQRRLAEGTSDDGPCRLPAFFAAGRLEPCPGSASNTAPQALRASFAWSPRGGGKRRMLQSRRAGPASQLASAATSCCLVLQVRPRVPGLDRQVSSGLPAARLSTLSFSSCSSNRASPFAPGTRLASVSSPLTTSATPTTPAPAWTGRTGGRWEAVLGCRSSC